MTVRVLLLVATAAYTTSMGFWLLGWPVAALLVSAPIPVALLLATLQSRQLSRHAQQPVLLSLKYLRIAPSPQVSDGPAAR